MQGLALGYAAGYGGRADLSDLLPAITGLDAQRTRSRAVTTFRPGNRRAAKLTPNQVLEIRQRYADGETQRRLASDFGMSVGHIGRIVRGEQWADYAQVPTDQELESAMASGPIPTAQELAESMARLEQLRSAPVEPEVDLLEQVLKRRGGDDPLRRLPTEETRTDEDLQRSLGTGPEGTALDSKDAPREGSD